MGRNKPTDVPCIHLVISDYFNFSIRHSNFIDLLRRKRIICISVRLYTWELTEYVICFFNSCGIEIQQIKKPDAVSRKQLQIILIINNLTQQRVFKHSKVNNLLRDFRLHLNGGEL